MNFPFKSTDESQTCEHDLTRDPVCAKLVWRPHTDLTQGTGFFKFELQAQTLQSGQHRRSGVESW